MSRFSQTGDTIVEVLISMAILAIVITVTYMSSSHSLNFGVDSSNRQQAIGLAEQQIELIKTSPAAYTGSGFFICNKNGVKNDSVNCQNPVLGVYTINDSNSGNLYTIQVTWPGPSGVTSNVTLYYKAA